MARTFSGGQRTAIQSAHSDHYVKLEVTNGSGTWKDVSSLGAVDWLQSLTIDEDIDQHTMSFSAVLLREASSLLSLSPLRTDSTINVDDAAAYAPLLELVRQWRVSVAVVAHGDSPSYTMIGAGVIDTVQVNPDQTITITGRDYGGQLLDYWIDTERTYSSGGADSMQTVIQAMLDDNGFSAITLYTPTSPAFTMNKWVQQKESLMSAINRVARLAGFVCRFRYDAADVFRLTLYKPNRSSNSGDVVWTLAATEYAAVPLYNIDIAGVRNKIIVQYWNSAGPALATATRSDATSISRYGGPYSVPRTLEIDLSADSQITTTTRANALGDAVLGDLAYPDIEQQYDAPGFWIAQLSDYGKFTANSVHYNADQYGGVTHIRHVFDNGARRMMTSLSVRGQPAGAYRLWEPTAPQPIPTTLPLICRAKVQSTSATQVVVRVAVADPLILPGGRWGTVWNIGQGVVTLTYTATGCTINTPSSPQTIAAASITSNIDTTGTVDVTVDRAAFQAGTGRITFTATRTGRAAATDSADVPSQDGPGPVMDVVGTPGTTSFSIAYSTTGTFEYSVDGGSYGSVPASPFTVSRNAPGGASKILTFRCTRNGQTVTDQITVPPQELSVTLSLSAGQANDTGGGSGPPYHELVVTWSVSGMPAGTTYDVGYDNGGGNLDSDTGVSATTKTFTSVTFNGAPGNGALYVNAIYNGTTIATARRNKSYLG